MKRVHPSRRSGGTARAGAAVLATALALAISVVAACTEKSAAQATATALSAYDFAGPEARRYELPRFLSEISGLALTGQGLLLAQDDERAVVYELDLARRAARPLGGRGARVIRGDFEGIAVAGSTLFLVTSSGSLLRATEEVGPSRGSDEATGPLRFTKIDTGLESRCEFEGLAYDRLTDSLLLPCKRPRQASLRNHLVIFAVPLASLRGEGPPRVTIPLGDLQEAGLADGFHPSGIEVSPETGSLVLVSAVEETLLELDRSGRVVSLVGLSRRRHPQPEGITFSATGDLLLADEASGGPATVTVYPHRTSIARTP